MDLARVLNEGGGRWFLLGELIAVRMLRQDFVLPLLIFRVALGFVRLFLWEDSLAYRYVGVALCNASVFSSLLGLAYRRDGIIRLTFRVLFNELRRDFELNGLLIGFLPFNFGLPCFPDALH